MEKEKTRPTFKKTRPWYFEEDDSKEIQNNPVKPDSTQLNPVKPELTPLNPIKPSLEYPVKPGLSRFHPVIQENLDPIKPSLTGSKNLHGNPKKVLEFLSISLLDFQQLITQQLSMSKIAECTNLSRDSVKSALKFLIKNNIISRIDFFAGIHGWAQYSIEKNSFVSVQNSIQTGLNQVNQIGSNNSNNNLNTITIGDEWEKIDISPLEHRGLYKNSLLQLKNSSTPEIVQTSINHFAFSLEYTEKVKSYKDPISALITVLKRGEAWVDPNYVSPRERALRALNEARKQEETRLQKIEDELLDAELKKWSESLSEEQKKEIAPNKMPPAEVQLRNHFKSNYWPEIKKNLGV